MIQLAMHHDFIKFAAIELNNRRDFQYPPLGRSNRIIVRAKTEAEALKSANDVSDLLEGINMEAEKPHIHVVGVGPAPVAKANELFRYHLVLRTRLSIECTATRPRFGGDQLAPDCELAVDIEPMSML